MSAGRWLCRGEHYLEQVVLIFFVFFVFSKQLKIHEKATGKEFFWEREEEKLCAGI